MKHLICDHTFNSLSWERACQKHNHYILQVDRVFPLLKSPLVSAEAYETVEKLVSCVAAPRDMGADIAASLKMVADGSVLVELLASVQLSVTDVNQKPGVVDRIVTSLVQACKNGPLPPPSFTVLYPVSVLDSKYLYLVYVSNAVLIFSNSETECKFSHVSCISVHVSWNSLLVL